MALDTGASLTTIPTEIALTIGCNPAKTRRRTEMVTASGMEYVPVVNIPRMTVLGCELRNIEAACLTLPPQSQVLGLLGLNVLSQFNVLLYFLRRYLEVQR